MPRKTDHIVDLEVVEPDPQAGRWRFTAPFSGCSPLAVLYPRSGADPSTRATVPALWSRRQQRILVSESARLIELLDGWPSPAPQLWPEAQRSLIDPWRERFQGAVNDGVYRCGFARSQAAYDAAEQELFTVLAEVEAHLKQLEDAAGTDPLAPGPWLCGGSHPTLADVVLFPTLIRWEMVYAPLFGCSRFPLSHLPALWRWRARFWTLPGVAATCNAEAWRRDYFGALFPLHPSGIIPAGPDLSTLVNSHPGR